MNKYRREVTIEIIVGLFIFIALIVLGIFTIVLSHENMLKKSYPYEFVFSEVSGLREGDNVFLRGVNVGRIKQLDLFGTHVRVFASLDAPLHLRRGYKITVTSSSMLGGKDLKIYEGPDKAPPLTGNMTILGERPVDVLEDLGLAVRGFQSIINDVSEGRGTIGKLLNDESMYENMARFSEKLGDMLSSEEGDLFEDLRVTMANSRTLSQSLADGKGTLGQLISGDANAYEDFQSTMATFRSISKRIDEGEGTMGKLLRDDTLYDETIMMLEDARSAIDDAREASPITSFGSVFLGAF